MIQSVVIQCPPDELQSTLNQTLNSKGIKKIISVNQIWTGKDVVTTIIYKKDI